MLCGCLDPCLGGVRMRAPDSRKKECKKKITVSNIITYAVKRDPLTDLNQLQPKTRTCIKNCAEYGFL